MYLGVAGLYKGDWRNIDRSTLEHAASYGFKTVQIRVDNPFDISKTEIDGIKSLYQEFDFVIPQTVGNYGGGLCYDDLNERMRCVQFMEQMVRFSSALGSPNTYLRPGSMNKLGPWLPHPLNRTAPVFDRLIDSTRRISKLAASEGVILAIEGGVVCPVYSADRVKDLIDAVDSPNLYFNMDPVNFIGSIQDAYNTTALMEKFYRLLPNRIIGAHAKDFTLVESLLPRFEESIIGQPESMLDQETFLKGMQSVAPSGHVLIEHLPDEKIPNAVLGLRKAADRAGIIWDE